MFHVVFGLIMFGVFILSMIYFKEFKKLYSSVFFMLPFSIINIPLYLSELKTSINDPALLYYILFVFRAPHHYLPHKWPLMNWIYFIGFFIIFLIIFYKFSKIDEKFKKRFNVFISIIVFYYIIAIIFSSIFPINFIIKLQLFRISEFLNVIQFIFVGEFIYNYIYKRFSIFIKSSLIFLSILFVLIYTF